jgi:hypothetical protein
MLPQPRILMQNIPGNCPCHLILLAEATQSVDNPPGRKSVSTTLHSLSLPNLVVLALLTTSMSVSRLGQCHLAPLLILPLMGVPEDYILITILMDKDRSIPELSTIRMLM